MIFILWLLRASFSQIPVVMHARECVKSDEEKIINFKQNYKNTPVDFYRQKIFHCYLCVRTIKTVI